MALTATRPIAEDVAAVNRISAVPKILELAAHTSGMRFTAIARVTETNWTACAVYDLIDFGLCPGGELALETTICNEIRLHHQPVVFNHASQDPTYSSHHTPLLYGLESYISIPIIFEDGTFFGTLCAVDTVAAGFDAAHITKTFELFAALLAAALTAELREEAMEKALASESEHGILREEFVAVLGHDLRSPVQSIAMGAEMLARDLPEGRERRVAQHIQRSAMRMGELIHNILDLARGRLGSGIALNLTRQDELIDELTQVVSEVRSTHPDRVINLQVNVKTSPLCDKGRIAQVLSNLVSNAVAHGDKNHPIHVVIGSGDYAFTIQVENRGTPIPQSTMDKLFLPFTRGKSNAPKPGLGLGLYIAKQIATAHGGRIIVQSNASSTSFTFSMPLALDSPRPLDYSIDMGSTKSSP
ncbi:signal transduction histidine kinase [Rhodanobacter sp. K2T2]|uniref:GAF domain-containing sensor histidine kinase n=1 Tax=Rhodanobacter sp. K2T2 TaxID=2723085 RepID=UPI0015CCBBAC|nr:GAF domain-containing sensor histidine kinase [Rhodanobacter sp. K2T2]NYE30058.1 signal transduction histidine kinase [Rhodanobacter sp. K2T2]